MDSGSLLVIPVGALAALLALTLLLASVRRVPEGFHYTIERFGRFHRVLRPGTHGLIPLVDRIGARQDMRERQLAVTHQELITRDRVVVGVDALCFFQVIDAPRASYEVRDVDEALSALLATCLQTLVGERDLEVVLTDRAALNAALLAAADDAAATWGVQLTRTEVRDLRPPNSLLDAVRGELEARLKRRALILEAEGERRAAELRAEAQREGVLRAAEAEHRAARLDADAAERRAEGDARATLMLSRAMEQGSSDALNYLLARQYVDALCRLADADASRVMLLPLDPRVAASLDGVRDLATAALAEAAAARTPVAEEATPEAVADAIADARRQDAAKEEGAATFAAVADGRHG
ncbi:MAG: SPFH domain-containing protein [Pseudomonadales bacterium]|jgi:regulator of protease activity HflC (stomatin/prohibitin superfamily)|nr:SPFH domain-containing protein [Pseudomonadales bacterium]